MNLITLTIAIAIYWFIVYTSVINLL